MWITFALHLLLAGAAAGPTASTGAEAGANLVMAELRSFRDEMRLEMRQMRTEITERLERLEAQHSRQGEPAAECRARAGEGVAAPTETNPVGAQADLHSATDQRQHDERQLRADLYLSDFDRLMDAAGHLVAIASGGGGPFNMDQKFGVDMVLNSAKNTLVAALELDSGEGQQQRADRWLSTIKTLRSMSDTLSQLVATGRVTEQLGGYFPIATADVAEFANQVCGAYPSLRARVRSAFVKGAVPLCDDEPAEPAKLPPFGMADPAGHGVLSEAPTIATRPSSVPWMSELRTHQLWPTLVSTLNLHEVSTEANFDLDGFLSRLNDAARTAYAAFIGSGAGCGVHPVDGCNDNDEFFQWQGGQDASMQRLPLETEDRTRLKELATRACLAHVRAHRRPDVTLEDLGWPDGAGFNMWAAVLGGAQGNSGHGEHTHANAVCSGAFYSSVPRNTSASPIVFSDPRGSWALSREGGPWRPTMLFSGSSPGQPLAPFHQQYELSPRAGEVVVFPSWLMHSVRPQVGAEHRITYSFNVVGGTFMDAWARTAV